MERSGSVRVRDAGTLRGYVRLLRLSERTLADRAGIAHATVSQLLSGRRASCSTGTAQAIVSILGCPGEVFFDPFDPADRPLDGARPP